MRNEADQEFAAHQEWALSERPATVDDVDAIHEVAILAGQSLDQPPLATRSEILADLVHPQLQLATDTRVMFDADGTLVAYQVVYTERAGRTFLDIYLRPGLDESLVQHLLDRQLDFGINRALDDAHVRGLTDTLAITGAQRVDTQMFEAFARHGFQLARTYWRMQIDFATSPAPAMPSPPDQVTILAVDPNDDDVVRRVHHLHQAAFAEHYGHVTTELPEWTTEERHEAGYDPTLWRVVQVEGVDAALLIGSNRLSDEGQGHVDVLGVLREFRGRGLGRLLLHHAFAEYAQRGQRGVCLSVDSDNATGATRLYESVGMVAVEVIDTWELPLSAEVLDDVD